MDTDTHNSKWRSVRTVLIVAVSVVIVTGLFRLTQAVPPAEPTAPPASTSQTFEDLYQSLVGTFDSSAVVASKQGTAFQITKCIILKITGGTPCP